METGSYYLQKCKQMVDDINALYDCNGLTHPIVEAGVFEVTSPPQPGV